MSLHDYGTKNVSYIFWSALRMNGVEELINGIDTYVSCPDYGEESFGKGV